MPRTAASFGAHRRGERPRAGVGGAARPTRRGAPGKSLRARSRGAPSSPRARGSHLWAASRSCRARPCARLRTQLLLLDEPFEGVAPALAGRLLRCGDLKKEAVSVILPIRPAGDPSAWSTAFSRSGPRQRHFEGAETHDRRGSASTPARGQGPGDGQAYGEEGFPSAGLSRKIHRHFTAETGNLNQVVFMWATTAWMIAPRGASGREGCGVAAFSKGAAAHHDAGETAS